MKIEQSKSPRIKNIPYQKQMQFIKPNWAMTLGFIGFVAFLYLSTRGNLDWIYASFGSFAFALLAMGYEARQKRKNWVRINATCLDSEFYRDKSYDSDGIGITWVIQLLCEVEYDGKTYKVTPSFWRTFFTKWGAKKFLESKIKNGKCELYVNPDNPLETEIVGNDIKDFLLH